MNIKIAILLLSVLLGTVFVAGGYGMWEKKLTIKGSITVIEPELEKLDAPINLLEAAVLGESATSASGDEEGSVSTVEAGDSSSKDKPSTNTNMTGSTEEQGSSTSSPIGDSFGLADTGEKSGVSNSSNSAGDTASKSYNNDSENSAGNSVESTGSGCSVDDSSDSSNSEGSGNSYGGSISSSSDEASSGDTGDNGSDSGGSSESNGGASSDG